MYFDIKAMWESENAAWAESCRLKLLAKYREHLSSVKHHHHFGYDLKCKCGVSEREYAATRNEDREVCLLYAKV